MAKCPFLDPNFDLDIDEPCPVCGDHGNWCDDASKCVGDRVDTSDELHQILGDALRSVSLPSEDRGGAE